MPDTKIVIEHLDANELAEHEKARTFNQQVYEALKNVEIGNGFAVPVPADKPDRKKVIHAFTVFINGKDVKGTMAVHKIEPTKVILKRTA